MAKYMIVDGLRAEFTDEKNILQVIRNVGIHIPTFCYYTDLSIYGACRMCVAEDDKGNIIASCSTPPKDKMVIRTNTPKLHHHRKMILELLLAPTAGTAPSVKRTRNASSRPWPAGSAFTISALRTTGPITRSTTPLPPLSGI